ncbi:MAG TPA: MFS transporter [Acidimicrobiales bacterium]
MSPPPDDRVWTPERRGLAVGLVLTITMLAFEALGVSTAMPIVADDLDGVDLYGWAFTAALLGSLVGISLAGARVDRTGPGGPFLAGLALFAIGLVGAGTARSMPLLVAARFVQGLGVGGVPAVVYASIGRAFGERARARMFALLSSAWVVPGLVGPALSGTIAESVGWRWVFLGVLPFVAVNALLTAPALLRLGPPPSDPARDRRALRATHRNTVGLALVLAAAAAALVGGLNTATPASLALSLAGALAAIVPLRRLLPAGTFRAARGIPAAVATRGLHAAAFFSAQAFVPLALTDLRGQSATLAGIVLTGSTVTWTAGAWLQDHRGHVWGRATMVRRGLVLLIFGVAGMAAVVLPAVPTVVAALVWGVAGLGMGMAYSGLSLLVLAQAKPGQEGTASSALQLSEMLSVAVAAGLGGAAVAAADRGGDLRPGIAAAFAISIVCAASANLAARRLPGDSSGGQRSPENESQRSGSPVS